MNGLNLRIVRGGTKKSKNLIGYPPVLIESSFFNFGDNQIYESFTNAHKTDDQLAILKELLLKDSPNENIFKFLVVVYLLAEAKHPVKCFITRHITKTESLQNPFSSALAELIKSYTVQELSSYVEYMAVVSKLAACLENFPAGAAALKIVRIELAGFLVKCLDCCICSINEQTSLSPTEKNELFTLAHLSLRLLLHIVQKGSEDSKLAFIYPDTRAFIQELMLHEDVPMDTKSLSGILYLTMYVVENGPDSWADLLDKPAAFSALLSSDAGRLSLHAALVTVCAARLCPPAPQRGAGGTALVELVQRIMDIGDRNTADSPLTLAAARALLAASKLLQHPSGVPLVQALLPYVCSHLDHHMDSVRHLAAQMLGNIVKFCVRVKAEGDDKPLDSLFNALSSLDKHRKSYYVCLTQLGQCLGAGRLAARLPGLAARLMAAVGDQPVQACATLTLETLMQQHSRESDPHTMYTEWILPMLDHVATNDVDSTVLGLVESLMAKAVAQEERLLDFILPHIRQCDAAAASSIDLKCALMLSSATRRARVKLPDDDQEQDHVWRGLLPYDVLERAAKDVCDETRILSLSLLAQAPRSTEPLRRGELCLLLQHAQLFAHASPSYRQLLHAPLLKIMKRLEDSYKVFMRQPDGEADRVQYYQQFVEKLRRSCYEQLLPGANYSRRSLALQLLKWTEGLQLEGYQRSWRGEYVGRLLRHLEDSYDHNKQLALDVLRMCPGHLLQNEYSVSLQLEDILSEASSLKPTDCVSAAYKLELLRTHLPERIIRPTQFLTTEPSLSLARALLQRLRRQLSSAERDIVRAARDAPMYGLLHCLGHLMKNVEPQVTNVTALASWRQLVVELVDASMQACAAVAAVVNNSSPEGHLPMDAGHVGVNDHGNSGGIVLDDGRPVTAQMVLLCAWRTVKEVSLLLGTMSSRLSISPPEAPSSGLLSCHQLCRIGEHFTSLLAETQHRGAFEQAYVGFTELLARLWRSRIPELHGLPRRWLGELVASIAAGGGRDATRRSAGLPFMIQALVTTEVQVEGNPKCFHQCMGTLLQLARGAADGGTRVHCLNILRALYRNAALDESVAGYVGDGFVVALTGFEGDTWAERNASTLLFSALMSRVFGVQRARGRVTARDTMTGRVFFLRYPVLYDFMMEKLQAPSSGASLRPSVFPVLVLLSRLYPSSLEGSESALRLAALLPSAGAVARNEGAHARMLAAKAVLPLVSPLMYYSHIETLLTSIQQPTSHNYTHGALLQLTRLLGAPPEGVPVHNQRALSEKLFEATWALTQACGDRPDYVVADEFVRVLNMVMWRLPSLITTEMINFTTTTLESLLFSTTTPPVTFGREVCLANCMYLLLIISTKRNKHISTQVCNDAVYKHYDVTLAVLNYLLILHNSLQIECKFQEHLYQLKDAKILAELQDNPKYIQTLCNIFENSKYLECIQKSLKVLSLEKNTHKRIVKIKTGIEELTDEMTVRKLFELIENEHENLTHIYLDCLSTFVTEKVREKKISMELLLDVIRAVFACSTPDNGEDCREVVVRFLENNFVDLIKMETGLREADQFEYTATLWAIIATLLEDDECELRMRTSHVVSAHLQRAPAATTFVARAVRGAVGGKGEGQGEEGKALLVALALLDFRSEVCMTDEINDECRVFDQNERHNVILEETVWTRDCADLILQQHSENTLNHVLNICEHVTYKQAIDKLCNNNVIMFKKLAKGEKVPKSAALNPKIQLFINILMK